VWGGAMSGRLTYRPYREGDLPGLLRLWEEESGWGGLTPETWRRWYVETPHGPSLIVVALDGGEVVGQEVFTPARIVAEGREWPALRLSAPIIRKGLRSMSIRSVNHPAISLYIAGAIAGAAAGFALVYALPEHSWLPIFRWLHRFQDAEFGCVASPLDRATGRGGGRLIAVANAEFGPEFAGLWRSARAALGATCAVSRSPGWLEYKNRGHLVVEARAREGGALVGYAAIRKSDGLLVDLLARDPADLVDVLAAARDGLASLPEAPVGIGALKAMETPALRPALRELGFTPVDFTFAFVCDPLDPAIDPEAVAPGSWYLTPGD